MPRKTKHPVSDSINDGMNGQIATVEDHKEVTMTKPSSDFVIETDAEFEASVDSNENGNGKTTNGDEVFASLNEATLQNFWKERLNVQLTYWKDENGKDTSKPSSLKVIVNPEMDGAATFGYQTIDAKAVANLILCHLRRGAYVDNNDPKVALKVPFDIAVARQNVPSVAYVHWTHSGDFGPFGLLNIYPDGWTELGVYGGKLVPTAHHSAVTVAQAMNKFNNERTDKENKSIRVFYRCEALRAIRSGVNIRIKIGGQSEGYILPRFENCWMEDDPVKAATAADRILFDERTTYKRLSEQADQVRVVKSGGVIQEPPEIQKTTMNGDAIRVTSIDGEVLTVGEIPYPTHVWTISPAGHRSSIKELLGANPIVDRIWATQLIKTGATFEIAK